MDECNSLVAGMKYDAAVSAGFMKLFHYISGRGLHSFTFQLNLSALYGIGGARRGCVAHVKGVLRGV